MTIRISLELPLFNFERLDVLCPRIGHPFEKLWPFEFVESFRCSISSVYISYVPELDIREKSYENSISRKLPLFNFKLLDILCPRIRHLWEELWPFVFLESYRSSISSISIYYFPKSDILVITYDQSNFSRASVVKFQACRYIMSYNQTSEWNSMTSRFSRELPLSNFERLDILCSKFGHPCEKLWPFEFLESFRCSISRV